jgi:hypothetical protein
LRVVPASLPSTTSPERATVAEYGHVAQVAEKYTVRPPPRVPGQRGQWTTHSRTPTPTRPHTLTHPPAPTQHSSFAPSSTHTAQQLRTLQHPHSTAASHPPAPTQHSSFAPSSTHTAQQLRTLQHPHSTAASHPPPPTQHSSFAPSSTHTAQQLRTLQHPHSTAASHPPTPTRPHTLTHPPAPTQHSSFAHHRHTAHVTHLLCCG